MVTQWFYLDRVANCYRHYWHFAFVGSTQFDAPDISY